MKEKETFYPNQPHFFRALVNAVMFSKEPIAIYFRNSRSKKLDISFSYTKLRIEETQIDWITCQLCK